MELTLQMDVPPLQKDAAGTLRIGDSRVLLELVVSAFEDGATPEMIVQRYPTLTLADTYAVIAYYLRHSQEIQAYLTERENRAASVRKKIEDAQPDLAGLRQRLLARQQAQAL
ncbi:MAG: DUF433 domain-containing protein [Caldilineaceae bacterium]|nr:DUF433 domain-containing protein [Caldilineaceae bacterium]